MDVIPLLRPKAALSSNTNLFYKQLRFPEGAQMYYKQMSSSPHVGDVTITSQLKGINLSSLLDNTAAPYRNAIEVAAEAMTLVLLLSQALKLIWQPGFRIFHIFYYLFTNQGYLFMKQTCIMTFIILSIRLETFGDENIPFASTLM